MDLESAQNNVVAKLHLLKQVPRTTTDADGTSISTIPGPVTTKEKAQKKNDVKARGMLLMALPNEHLLTFSQYKDAKTLFEAIQARFGGYKKLVASWPLWRNKAYFDTMSFDDLYNNFKIVEQKVKRTITTSSSSGSQNMAFLSSPGSTNEIDTINIQVIIVSTPVSTVNTHDNTANLRNETVYAFLANHPNGSQLVHKDLEQIHEDDLEETDLKWQLALLGMRARRYFQKTRKKITINGSDTAGYDKIKVECFNFHKMGHFARECKSPRNQESRPRNQDSSRKTVIMEDTSSKEMVANDGAGLFAPPTVNLSNSYLEEFKQPEFEGYGSKASKSVSVDTSNEIKKDPDAPIIEDWVSDSDEDESEVMVLKSKNGQHKTENFAATAVLTKSGIVPISTARQNSSRAAAPISAARPINTAASKPIRKSVTGVVGKQGTNVVKSSACWVWRPKIKVNPQDALKDT
nr:hypothetical protein [Tanacetum cinerariifolium]